MRRRVRWSLSFSACRSPFTLAASLGTLQPSDHPPLRDLAGEHPHETSCSGLQRVNGLEGKTRGQPVKPWCLTGPASTVDSNAGRPSPSSQPTMPESSTELSTSFAPASKGSCTWLSSLVSLACPSGLVVIHGGIPTLRLMRRSSYFIVN